MEFILIISSIFAIAALIRPITILIHELGHGIPSLIFTKEEVKIFIGSYGSTDNGISFKLGRLKFFIALKLLLWRRGLCTASYRNTSLIQEITIIFMGPVASLIISFLSFYITIALNSHGFLKILCAIFFASSTVDFLLNIIPVNKPIALDSGKFIYNDGQQLKQIFKLRISSAKLIQAAELYEKEEFKKAVKTFQKLLDAGIYHPFIVSFAISSYLKIKDYDKAKELSIQFAPNFPADAMDWANSGIINSHFNNLDGAIKDYQKALELEPLSIYALNNRGYTYILQEQFEKALTDLNQAIEINPGFALAYCNLGLAKIKLGEKEAGFDDLNTAINLNDAQVNPYAYRNLGIYYLAKEDLPSALSNFLKAKELQIDPSYVDNFIEQTYSQLKALMAGDSLKPTQTYYV